MYNMYAKLLFCFRKELIYTEGLNLNTSMLSNIPKMFALVHISQFKLLNFFLVLDAITTRCAQLTVKVG